MKRSGKKKSDCPVIAMALTWDGARWPTRTLPPRARAFLAGQSRNNASFPATGELSRLFADDQVREIRICWLPRLKGGSEVLSKPFATSTGRRIAFRVAACKHFGEILGVIYRKITG